MSQPNSLLLGLLVLALAAHGQRPERTTDQPASLLLRTGPALLYGDLNELRTSPSLGLGLNVPLNRWFGMELLLDAGLLRASQRDFYQSGSEARFGQSALAVSADLLALFSREGEPTALTVYGGAGLIYFNARASHLTTGALQRLTNNANSYRTRDGIRTRGRPGRRNTHELVLPLGIRLSTLLSSRLAVMGDLRYQFVRTDKLDATLDGNNQTLEAGKAQTEGNHYGRNSQDRWAALSVGFVYYFGNKP